ncbi:MAG TPA: SoxY-related AACIE arm protein [Caldimonas sp.]|nr:SoxY-related AACIE arm protein [Caldimonas sp.]HEX2540332.1 SoxY-related AACIE arm protein [Caldimonas sp.]
MLRRRTLVLAGGAGLAFGVRPAHAALAPALVAAVHGWAGTAAPPGTGRVRLEIAPLVENGNAVPITVKVESPMTVADHVREIAVFTEKNPQLDVVRFHLGPGNGRAEVATRIRLATSQHVVALARLSDGSVWQHAVSVLVTLAACIEG